MKKSVSDSPIPLSLYIHLPYCLSKCPYCDFNSYAIAWQEDAYVKALTEDLRQSALDAPCRPLSSIYFGGGTPSLFSPKAIAALLDETQKLFSLAPDIEITLEANPGTIEQGSLPGFAQAGVNRLSLGVQSFSDACLKRLGRIHGTKEAIFAAKKAKNYFSRVNIDLMMGLPGQALADFALDLDTFLQLDIQHLSLYELTLEPNTFFYCHPPRLPPEDALAAMEDLAQEKLAASGFRRYEISAWALAGEESRHNANYWTFGDYLGMGAGAAGKLSRDSGIERIQKLSHPKLYIEKKDKVAKRFFVSPQALPLEFMMNALRLAEGVPARYFLERTGLPLEALEPALAEAKDKGFIEDDPRRLAPTPLGRRFLNECLLIFSEAVPA